MKLRVYEVVISFHNVNRTNKLVVWAEDPEIAKDIALKWWGGPTEALSFDVEVREMKKGELGKLYGQIQAELMKGDLKDDDGRT